MKLRLAVSSRARSRIFAASRPVIAAAHSADLGVPSVSFDCPTGPAEILGADTGLLVPQGDVVALSRAIVELLQQRPLRERFAHAAIARSRERFSLDEHRRRWRTLVARVAS